MSNPVFLRLPNSTEWKVYWMKRDGDVWFRNGWKEFAEYLSLDVAQFLMFQHQGKSHFKVVIFGKNALEIKYPSSSRVADKKRSLEVDESDCSVEIVPSFVGKRQKYSSPSSPSRKKMKINPKEEPESYSNHAETMHEVKKVPPSIDIDDMSKALFEEVKKNFKSENNFFICRCQRTYTERDLMIIPKEFWEHLHAKDGDAATLSVKGITWDVRIKFSSKQVSFCESWKKFFQDNNLKLGDVCAFVQDKYQGFSFEVVIYRLGDNCSTLLSEDQKELSRSFLLQPLETLKLLKLTTDVRRSTNEFTLASTSGIMLHFIVRHVLEKLIHNDDTYHGWQVRVLYYPHYSSVKFSVGWLDFVRDCDLKEDDACHLQ
ncbi:hypothetical protein RIF29_14775 [Crotalaria pallida]|uniref:TF-B3 domain-containing protein n=1 Tax=Crotalaria pallida TaxID=3830 RepID=A0AAN9IE20_CROPI